MSVRKILTMTAVASLMVAPAVAQAAPTAASKLSVRSAVAATPARAGAVVRNTNREGSGSIIIAVGAAAAVIVGIVIAADNNNTPTSG